MQRQGPIGASCLRSARAATSRWTSDPSCWVAALAPGKSHAAWRLQGRALPAAGGAHTTVTPPLLAAVRPHLTCCCRPAVVRDTLLGAVATQLLQPCDQVVSLFHRRLAHGYPTPSLGRDAVLGQALPWLQQRRIWSRGRFGAYKVRGVAAAGVVRCSMLHTHAAAAGDGSVLLRRASLLVAIHNVLPACLPCMRCNALQRDASTRSATRTTA